jgi:hypothetical protein
MRPRYCLQFKTLFIRLIICTFQFVFSGETVFFSHSKSANSVFSRLISTAERGLNQITKRTLAFLALTVSVADANFDPAK